MINPILSALPLSRHLYGLSKINLLILALAFATLIASFQRYFLRRSFLRPVSVDSLPIKIAPGIHVSISKVYPEAYTEDTYQLAYIVQSLRPDSALRNRSLINGDGGQVSVGLTAQRLPELQTCLMESGQGAVTNKRMVAEVNSVGRAEPGQRFTLIMEGILFGRTLKSRPCLFVQVRLNTPVSTAGVDQVSLPDVVEQNLLDQALPILDALRHLEQHRDF